MKKNNKYDKKILNSTINSLLIGKLNKNNINLELYQNFINKSIFNLNSNYVILEKCRLFDISKIEIFWIIEEKIYNEFKLNLNNIRLEILKNLDNDILFDKDELFDNLICFENDDILLKIEIYNYNDLLTDYKLKSNIFNQLKVCDKYIFLEGLSYLDFLKLNIHPKINVNDDFSKSFYYKFKLSLISKILFD